MGSETESLLPGVKAAASWKSVHFATTNEHLRQRGSVHQQMAEAKKTTQCLPLLCLLSAKRTARPINSSLFSDGFAVFDAGVFGFPEALDFQICAREAPL